MEQGPVEKKVIEAALRAGHPLPQRIQNAPDIPLGLELFYTAFMDLSSERADGPIPNRSIKAYCRDEDFDGELTEDVLYHVRSLDNALLEYRRKKAEKGEGTGHG